MNLFIHLPNSIHLPSRAPHRHLAFVFERFLISDLQVTYKRQLDILRLERQFGVTNPDQWYDISTKQVRATKEGKKILRIFKLSEVLPACDCLFAYLIPSVSISRARMDKWQILRGPSLHVEERSTDAGLYTITRTSLAY